ncbi:MAG: YggT family protein [Oscillospiraceae bacterium]|jgi:uncharacterized protein YggT (Ycf19 family)|nr:YggT family protein [Oscillospiraceae bacterium]
MIALRVLIEGVILFIQALSLLMIAYFALLWFFRSAHPAARFMGRILDPPLAPLRRLIARLPIRIVIDLSPLLALLILQPIRSVLLWLLWKVL